MKSYKYLFLFFIFFSCIYDSTNREETVKAFEDNFGFTPSQKIETIKVRNVSLRDAVGHWMSFTYDFDTFNKIIKKDQPLQIFSRGSSIYDESIKKLTTGANIPLWFDISKTNPEKIYFKENFLEHSFSEYFLLIDSKKEIVYLHVSYFD